MQIVELEPMGLTDMRWHIIKKRLKKGKFPWQMLSIKFWEQSHLIKHGVLPVFTISTSVIVTAAA